MQEAACIRDGLSGNCHHWIFRRFQRSGQGRFVLKGLQVGNAGNNGVWIAKTLSPHGPGDHADHAHSVPCTPSPLPSTRTLHARVDGKYSTVTDTVSIAVWFRCGHRRWFRRRRSRSLRCRLMLCGATAHNTKYQCCSDGGKKVFVRVVHLVPPFFSWM